MTVKDAVTNSLLMFVAATCVVLIVRALPQTSTPHVEAAATVAGRSDPTVTPTLAMQDGVKVYYLHGNFRCPTCRTIEAYAKEAVELGFAEELKSRQVEWQVINYESPGNQHYATDYNVVAPNVVLVRFQDGKQVDWKGLPEVWEHVSSKESFLPFVQDSLRKFIQNDAAPPSGASPPASVQDTAPDDPLPIP